MESDVKEEKSDCPWRVDEESEEKYNFSGEKGLWQPKPEDILSMFDQLSKGGTLPLQWTCPGRRAPESEETLDKREEIGMEVDEEESKEEEAREPEPCAFDFDESQSDVSVKTTPMRALGGPGRTPRTEKRVARMDNIMDSLRKQQMQRAAEREARRAKASPSRTPQGKGRLLKFGSPLAQSPKKPDKAEMKPFPAPVMAIATSSSSPSPSTSQPAQPVGTNFTSSSSVSTPSVTPIVTTVTQSVSLANADNATSSSVKDDQTPYLTLKSGNPSESETKSKPEGLNDVSTPSSSSAETETKTAAPTSSLVSTQPLPGAAVFSATSAPTPTTSVFSAVENLDNIAAANNTSIASTPPLPTSTVSSLPPKPSTTPPTTVTATSSTSSSLPPFSSSSIPAQSQSLPVPAQKPKSDVTSASSSVNGSPVLFSQSETAAVANAASQMASISTTNASELKQDTASSSVQTSQTKIQPCASESASVPDEKILNKDIVD